MRNATIALALLLFGCAPAKQESKTEKPELQRVVEAIVNACDKYDFPVDWALAVCLTESGFKPGLTTYEKAARENSFGLGQVLYSTARWIKPGVSEKDLHNEEINADIFVQHLRNLNRKHCGDMVRTLREYNGGTRWAKKNNHKYYLAVVRNKKLISEQEAYHEKSIFYDYYHALCLGVMRSAGLVRP